MDYYITAGDDLDGDVKTASWPADTTGVLDFSVDSAYPDFGEIRGLPDVGAPVAGEFPHARILLWDETGSGDQGGESAHGRNSIPRPPDGSSQPWRRRW